MKKTYVRNGKVVKEAELIVKAAPPPPPPKGKPPSESQEDKDQENLADALSHTAQNVIMLNKFLKAAKSPEVKGIFEKMKNAEQANIGELAGAITAAAPAAAEPPPPAAALPPPPPPEGGKPPAGEKPPEAPPKQSAKVEAALRLAKVALEISGAKDCKTPRPKKSEYGMPSGSKLPSPVKNQPDYNEVMKKVKPLAAKDTFCFKCGSSLERGIICEACISKIGVFDLRETDRIQNEEGRVGKVAAEEDDRGVLVVWDDQEVPERVDASTLERIV